MRFGGTAPAQVAALGAQVQAVSQNPVLAVPAVRDGRLRALAITSTSRWRVLPEVPTVAELGCPGFEAVSWYGVLGPIGLPDRSATALRAVMEQDLAKWGDLIGRAGIRGD